MLTVLQEIEAAVNSRPLTFLYSDQEEPRTNSCTFPGKKTPSILTDDEGHELNPAGVTRTETTMELQTNYFRPFLEKVDEGVSPTTSLRPSRSAPMHNTYWCRRRCDRPRCETTEDDVEDGTGHRSSPWTR
ncbi:unnamed protein product [Ixodes hexagonus]